MAVRNEARILTSIWAEPDWTTLTYQAQWAYKMLLSQPNLGFAGIIATTRARWARNARGMTTKTITAALRELEQAHFIVVDDDTEEVLVRTFIRNDDVWKQPKLLRIAIREALSCGSLRIQETIANELAKCEPVELSDKPTSVRGPEGQRSDAGPSVRTQIEDLIVDAIPLLIKGRETASPSLGPSTGPYGRPSTGPSLTPSLGASTGPKVGASAGP